MKTGLVFFAAILIHVSVYAQDTATVGGVGGNYTNLVGAFNAINSGTLSGHVVLKIQSNIWGNEGATLNASGTGNSNYSSLTIYPTVPCIIYGYDVDDVIIFNGADSVTIDGRINRQGNSRDMTILNSYDWGERVIQFRSGAMHNVIEYVNIKGNTGGNGQIAFVSLAGDTVGNSFNTIQFCNFDKNPSYFPTKAIYSTGNINAPNNNNLIANNIFHAFASYGIQLLGHNKDWEVKYNSFYSTSNMGNVNYMKLENLSANGAFNVHHNNLGGVDSLANGNAVYNELTFAAITVSDSSSSSFNNNLVRGITSNGYNMSLLKLTGSVNVFNNVFGGDSMSNQIYMHYSGKLVDATYKCNFTNNRLKNINTALGLTSLIYKAKVVKNNNISNCENAILIDWCDSVISNIITNISGSAINACNLIDKNSIRNIIVSYSTCISGNYVSNNFLKNFTSYSTSSNGYLAIACEYAINNVIISDTSGFYALRGRVEGIQGYDYIYNNIIKLVFNSVDSIINFQGATGLILDGTGSGDVYNNTILIGGKFLNQYNGVSSNIKINYSVNWQIHNNLLYNSNVSPDSTRSQCILYSGTVSFISDYNNYYLSGSNNAVVSSSSTAYPTLTDWLNPVFFTNFQDAHSISIDPIFNTNPPNSITDFIPQATMHGTNTVVNPYDILGNARPSNYPTMGAIESGACVPALAVINPIVCQSFTFGGQTFTNNGTYTVNVDNAGSCDTLYTINLTIDSTTLTPSVISSNSSLTICQGDSVLLSGNNSGGVWNTGDTSASIYASAGNYFVTNNYLCGSVNSNYLTVANYHLLTPAINDSMTYLVVDSAIYNQYQWYFNGIAIPGANGPSYIPVNTGDYSLQVSGTNACIGTSSLQYFGIVGINESNSNIINIAPNPSSGFFTISSAVKLTHIQITDMVGNIICESEPGRAYTEINIANFSKGIYTVTCVNEKGISTNKIVIQ